MQTTLYLLSAAATVCIIIGLGWWYITGDWLTGSILLLIGIMNAARFWQIYKEK